MTTSSPMTVAKWIWWSFLFVVPLLAFLLLRVGAPALPVNLVVTAVPVYVTHRILRDGWRTGKAVKVLFALSAIAAVLLAFTDGTRSFVSTPEWVSGLIGFYFMAAPLFMTGAVLYELHRLSLHTT